MSNIAVIGIGYVGLVSAVCFAEMGHKVTCIDIDQKKIDGLNQGEVPIYEIGLPELLSKNKNSLHFTSNFKFAKDADVIFVAVGTPQGENGSANLEYFFNAIQQIADIMTKYTVIVDKSTVPIGTAEHVKSIVETHLRKRNVSVPFDVVSNPEFLREGTSIQDFMNPDRIVIGTDSKKAQAYMQEIYRPLAEKGRQIIFTNSRSAETIKYASNSFLAVKIAFINELSALCDNMDADISQVAYGIGTDHRISSAFLNAGPGYGGSCFPKDTQALMCMAEAYDTDLSIIKSAIAANEKQKKRMCAKIKHAMDNNVKGKTVAVLGLAFKKNTDDMRNSPALIILEYLFSGGANIKAYDPAAMPNAKAHYFKDENVYFARDKYDAAHCADALIILTEWDDFKTMNLGTLKEIMSGNLFIDLRNLYERENVEKMGFRYFCVGR